MQLWIGEKNNKSTMDGDGEEFTLHWEEEVEVKVC